MSHKTGYLEQVCEQLRKDWPAGQWKLPSKYWVTGFPAGPQNQNTVFIRLSTNYLCWYRKPKSLLESEMGGLRLFRGKELLADPNCISNLLESIIQELQSAN